jgi:hypothetical protein
MAFFLILTQRDFELLPIVVLDPDGIVSDPTVHNSAGAMCCHARQCSAIKSEKHIKVYLACVWQRNPTHRTFTKGIGERSYRAEAQHFYFSRPLSFPHHKCIVIGGRSLPESCPRNGDLPKSPFLHWQHRCHRLAQS